MQIVILALLFALFLTIVLPPILVWFERGVSVRSRAWASFALVVASLAVQGVLGGVAGYTVSLQVDSGKMGAQAAGEIFTMLALASQVVNAIVVVVFWRLIVRRWHRQQPESARG